MEAILRGYEVNDPTWFYLSFILIVGVYFKFNRIWSIRNIDLLLLLAIAPGLLLIPVQADLGYVWLFVVLLCLMARMLLDVTFKRRPRHEPNMNWAGLVWLCTCTFAFLMTKVLTDPPPAITVESVRQAEGLIERETTSPREVDEPRSPPAGPGSRLLVAPVVGFSKMVTNRGSNTSAWQTELLAARMLAILAHLAVVCGLVYVAWKVFADVEAGVAMATLYMLLPGTAFDMGKVDHVLPSAFIVWAIGHYRRPLISGMLLGFACGTLFFPIFLLPLWVSFYGRQGGLRFSLAVLLITATMVGSVFLLAGNVQAFLRQTVGYIHWTDLQLRTADAAGFWRLHEAAYRIPVFVTFLVLIVAVTIWPARKTLAHVLASSAAIVIGTQFWYPEQGGVYVLWYLPLVLLTVFRPAQLQKVASDDMEGVKGGTDTRKPAPPQPLPAKPPEPSEVRNTTTKMWNSVSMQRLPGLAFPHTGTPRAS